MSELKKKTRKNKFYVGTSGFSYPNWHGKGGFYPANCPSDLSHYVQYFNFVEVNNSFYHYPNPKMFSNWKKIIPKNFIFAIKANRLFTHSKKLNVDDKFIKSWQDFWDICVILKPQLGPILFQLHPSVKFKTTGLNSTSSKLEKLYDILPTRHPVVFECRDQSWQCEEVLKLFKKYNWCFCVIHINNESGWAGNLKTGFFPNDKSYWQTAKWGSYFRLHGNLGQYYGLYKDKILDEIIAYYQAQKLKTLYTAFDNTDDTKPSSAIKNALKLTKKLNNKI